MHITTILAALLFAVAVPVQAEPGVTDKQILIGQTVGLTGPVAEIAQEYTNGAKAYFDALNDRGGIHGRAIRTITLDDGAQVPRTVANVERLLGEHQVFALLNVMGTPNVSAVLPIVEKSNVSLFSPFTGADLVRVPPKRNVFNVRASYSDETEKLVQHLSTVGITRISAVYQATTFGKDGLAGVERALDKRGKRLGASVSILADGSDAALAVASLKDVPTEAIVLLTAGKASSEFIRTFNRSRRGMQFYTLSVMGSQSNIESLGKDGVGVVVAAVVPFPWSQGHPLVSEYQSAMRKAGFSQLSFLSLEGYINAKVLADVIRKAGPTLTRDKLITSADGFRADYGGFAVAYDGGSRLGSRFVDLTIIGPDGRFRK